MEDFIMKAFTNPAGLMLGAGSYSYFEYRNNLGGSNPKFLTYLGFLFWIRLWWMPVGCFFIFCLMCLIKCKCIKVDQNGARSFKPRALIKSIGK